MSSSAQKPATLNQRVEMSVSQAQSLLSSKRNLHLISIGLKDSEGRKTVRNKRKNIQSALKIPIATVSLFYHPP
jgi:hypothetical protein